MKTKTRKKIVTLLVLLMSMSLMCIAIFSIPKSNDISIAADELCEGKKYCNTTINEDFADDTVLVVIDKYHSQLNKRYEKDFFNGVSVKSVTDLMATSKHKDNGDLTFLNADNFRQVLQVELEEPSKQNVLDAVHKIEQIEGVLSASPSHIFQNYSMPSCVVGSRYDELWGLHGEYGIDIESAWNITKGNSFIRVGIIDTGVDSHIDLAANLATGWNVLSENTEQMDTVGHGTHIAGTIGASGNNEEGIVGVAQNVTLIPIQAAIGVPLPRLNTVVSLMNEASCVSAIEWAIENNIVIINFSIGTYSEPLALKTAISNYKGLFVCAAGNGKKTDNQYIGVDTDTVPFYPACYTNDETLGNRIISVGAIDSAGDITNFSNYGANTVDLFAPGKNILSTVPTDVVSEGYAYFDGTSMATPHVVGVAALVWSKLLGNPYGFDQSEIAEKVKEIILTNLAKDSRYSGKSVSGGRLIASKPLEKMPYRKVMSGFKYISGVHNWYGKEDLLIAKTNSFYLDSSNVLVFNSNTDLTFSLGTEKVYNAWHEVVGTVTFTLKNSADEIIQINGNDVFTSSFRVGLVSNVTYTNRSFTVNTGSLPNDTYTLSLSCVATRDGSAQRSVAEFVFKISSSCIADGSMITLADGSQVAVENLTGAEDLLVWNMITGQFDSAKILFIDSDPNYTYEIIKLTFSDGTEIKVIDEHAFFDMTIGKYVFLRKDAERYIGHYFNKKSGNGWVSVQLTDVTIITESTAAWSPVTHGHLCYYVNGLLSMPGGTEGLINIFDVDTTNMKYGAVEMAQDIALYGVYTYEEFREIIPIEEEIFEAFNGQYLKVSVGKGLITLPKIVALLQKYSVYLI